MLCIKGTVQRFKSSGPEGPEDLFMRMAGQLALGWNVLVTRLDTTR